MLNQSSPVFKYIDSYIYLVLDQSNVYEQMFNVILVSALGPNPNPSFFPFLGALFNLGVCWDWGLDLDQGLDQGLTKMTY